VIRPAAENWSAGPGGDLPSYFDDRPPNLEDHPIIRSGMTEWPWEQWRVPVDSQLDDHPIPSGPRQAEPPPGLLRSSQLPVTFLRAFDLPFVAAAPALHKWWRDEAIDGALQVGHSRLVGPPRQPESGRCQIDVDLHRSIPGRALRMELELVPWSRTFGTKIGLCPRHNVRASRLYFNRGHALLDAVIAALGRHAAGLSTLP
jgi:hypothetical protein